MGPDYQPSVSDNQDCLVEGGAIAQQRVALVATQLAAGLKVVGALATGTLHLLAVARPREGNQAGTVGADAVVGNEAVEIGATDNQPDLVARPQHVGRIVVFLGRGNDVVFLALLSAVALCQHVAQAVVVDTGVDVDIAACRPTGGEDDAGLMPLHIETETAGVAMTDGVVFLA